MAGSDWSNAVEIAVRRLVARSGSADFTRQQMIEEELGRIVRQVGSRGATPEMTLSRELQQLRDRGGIEFLTPGHYRLREVALKLPQADRGKCVFVVGSHSIYGDVPERFYRFGPQWLRAAARSVGQWIVYQEPRRAGPRGYHAVARVEQVVRDPDDADMFLALIEPGTYLELGRDVAVQLEGQAVKRGLLGAYGRLNNDRAIQSIRPISDDDFNRIVELGLIEDDEFLPREDADKPLLDRVHEQHEPWLGPIDRATMLVNRVVRNRQFRKRVLDVYDRRCALTGMQLINGGGRAEAQAAHIMSVEAGGPDTVANGIALSGTVHWMFDRGLISLSDSGEILLSNKINDIDGVTKLLHPDRRARLPANENLRPHVRFLTWHREYHRFVA
ncbi:HNH endonuclease [Novosphingobium lentum]|uniref:HNH endonuclease n=1 Tax=Novosphingobium lentum TaxID=145287 RepID=UPI000AAC3470|nr:HNH endonuclease [Novosphingobium lentum]